MPISDTRRLVTASGLLLMAWPLLALSIVYHDSLETAWARERHISLVRDVIARAEVIAAWRNTDMHVYHPEDRPFKMRKHSGISSIEVNVSSVLLQRLIQLRAQFNIGNVVLGEYFSRGRRCTIQEMQLQQDHFAREMPSVCAEMQAYKFAHLAWPEASVFIDVGADRGYISAFFLSLWGGGGYGLSPFYAFEAYQAAGRWANKGGLAGYCKSGLNRGYPLLCREEARAEDGMCREKKTDFRLFSIDSIADNVNVLSSKLILGKLKVDTAASESDKEDVWKIFKFALSENMRSGNDVVRNVSLTDFAKSNRIEGDINVVRINIGGSGYDIVRNSLGLLEHGKIGMISFNVPDRASSAEVSSVFMTLQNLERIHFDCYVPYYTGVIKVSGSCLRFDNNAYELLKRGKIVCASRLHAPAVVLVYDALMLGMQ